MDDFVLISQVAKETPYSAEYLSLLVRKGRIAGKKFGRNWTISRSALNEYLAGHRVVIAPQQVYKTVLASEPLSPISPLTPISNSQGQTFSLRSEASEGQVREVPRSDLKSEKDLAVEVKKELDELENIYQNKISGGKLSIPLEPLSPPLAEKGEMGMMGEKSDKAKFSFPRISEMGTMGGTGERGKWNKNSYGRNVVQWAEMAIVSILVLGFILGGFNFKFADALYGAFKDLINNAMTLDGHAPGTHANEVLLLDKGGNISINGNVETNGQLKSHVPEGVAPLEVDSRTTVPNLSANFLEGLTAASFDLQLVTGHGAVTSNRVKLGGGAEILNSLLVNAPSVFTEYVSVAKDLFVNGKATIANGLDVMGNSSIIGRLTVKGDVDISNLVAAQRAQIKEGGLTVSGATQLNSLGVTGGASMSDLGISGNFAVAGKEISLGDSGADKLTITASTTFSGGGRFLVGPEATFNKHVGIDSGGLSVIGASSITGASSIIGNTTITGDLSVSGATSFGLNFGVGTSTPGGALGVKGAGLFDGFVSANYFTSTSSLTSWLMGQMGIGTTTPGAEMGVKGGILSEGFVSADYFTSTSTNSNWFNGALGLGTTTPGARLATKGSIISEGFISADYFTSTSTNSSWIFGNLGVGTTTPGAQLAINGTLMALTGTSTLGGLISPSVFSTTSLNFYTNSNSTPRMVIDTIGNVGIGTSSPAVTLGVNGSGLFTNNLTVEGTTDLQGNVTFGSSVTSDSTATSTFNGGISAVGLSSSMGLTLTGGDAIISGTINVDGSGDSYVIGNLGVGTTTPGSKLAIDGDASVDGLYAMGTTTTSSLIATSTIEVRSSAYSAGTLFNTFKEKIGIATSTPGSLLSVHGNANIGELTVEGQLKTSFITATSTTNNTFAGALDVTESATSTFTGGVNVLTTGGLSSATGLTITGGDILSSGKLTLTGASTSTIPQLNASTILTVPTLDISTILKNSGTATSTFAGGLSLGTGGLNITSGGLYVDSGDVTFDQKLVVNGNVGIGTTGPVAPLDIWRSTAVNAIPMLSIRSDVNTAGDYSMIRFGEQSQTTFQKGAIIYEGRDANTRGKFHFALEDTADSTNVDLTDAKMTIQYDGNVGIGTTGPASEWGTGTTLQVQAGVGTYSIASLSTTRADANSVRLGSLTFDWPTNTATYRTRALIEAQSNGSTANKRGADLVFATANDNVANPAEVMRILNNGNVGIGTTSPSTQFHIDGGTGATDFLLSDGNNLGAQLTASPTFAHAEIQGTGATYNDELGILETANMAADNQASIGFYGFSTTGGKDPALFGRVSGLKANATTGNFAGYLTFSTNGNTAQAGSVLERMRIASDGNVGIGTTSPAAMLALTGGRGTYFDSTGNVGIGIASPQYDVQLYRASGSAKNAVVMGSIVSKIQTDSDGSYVGTESNHNLFLITNNAAKMTILSGGNVGIGTTEPGAKLDVLLSSTAVRPTFTGAGIVGEASPTLGTGTGKAIGVLGLGRGLGEIAGDRSYGGYFVASSQNLLGVLEVGLHAETSSGAGTIAEFYDATTPIMVIKSNGNVGIGDSGPDALLDVKGTVCLDLNADEACTDNTSALSDSRLKTNVVDLTDSLALVNSLRPVRFDWNGEYNVGTAASLGFIAQEIEVVFPELVITDTAGYKNLDYAKLTAVLAGGMQELYASTSPLTDNIFVNSDGNVGIGSTTPNYKLAVAGDVAATSFINISTKTAKKDITYLSESDEQSVLEKIRNTNVATYEYINDEARSTKHETNSNDLNSNDITKGKSRLGLIAEEAPVEVLSIDGKGVDIYKLSSFILAGVKAQQLQIDQLKTDVALIKSNLQGLTLGPDQGQTLNLGSAIQDLGYKIIIVAKSTLAELASTIGDWANAALAETTKLIVKNEDEANMTYKTYSVQGSRDEIIASGSAVLKGLTLPDQGQTLIASARIKFDESFVAAISETENIKVILTPTSRLNGALYVHAKSRFGFEVREINALDEGGMFDWMVIARKKGGEDAAIGPISPIGPITPVPVETPVAEATPAPVVEEVAPVPAEEPASTVAEPAPMEEVVPVEEPVAPAPVEEPVTPSAGEPVITPTEEVAPAPAVTPPAEEPAP